MSGIKGLLVMTLFVAMLPLTAFASPRLIDCSYAYMGMPFSENQVALGPDESPGATVKIIVQGQAHAESLTPAPRDSDELLHAWISKESPDNSVEMIVYRESQALGQSKVINHHVPLGQEVWGTCQFQ